ncbi:MAG: YkgJ family cysteine cluster protein [Crenarchaeota archaeon]|nr:YkgJ family cysteine cluster protein [Thermoproteota archaeon]
MFECPYNEECRSCCVFEGDGESPIVFEDEKRKLEALGAKDFVKLGAGLYRWRIKGRCPFNDPRTGLCKIHEEKPLSCKMFPLNLVVKGREVRVEVSRACPWVREHWDEVLSRPPEEVFPKEWEALKAALRKLLGE